MYSTNTWLPHVTLVTVQLIVLATLALTRQVFSPSGFTWTWDREISGRYHEDVHEYIRMMSRVLSENLRKMSGWWQELPWGPELTKCLQYQSWLKWWSVSVTATEVVCARVTMYPLSGAVNYITLVTPKCFHTKKTLCIHKYTEKDPHKKAFSRVCKLWTPGLDVTKKICPSLRTQYDFLRQVTFQC